MCLTDGSNKERLDQQVLFFSHEDEKSFSDCRSLVALTFLCAFVCVVQVGNQRVELTLNELQDMATRQQQQIEAQQQMLVAKVTKESRPR